MGIAEAAGRIRMAGCRLLFVVERGPERWDIRLGRPEEETEGRILALNDEPAVVLSWLRHLCAAGRRREALVVVARPDSMLGTLHALETEDGAREALAGGGRLLGRVEGRVEEVAAALGRWLAEDTDVRVPPDPPSLKRIAIA